MIKKGSLVRLSGTKGIVSYADGKGMIHVDWENGSASCVAPEKIEVLREGYMPAFRFACTVKMNRPVDSETDFFSPGKYEMVLGEREALIDFEDYCGCIDKDRTIVHCLQKNPDLSAFPDIEYLVPEDFGKVTAIKTFGFESEAGLEPVQVMAASFFEVGSDFKEHRIPKEVLKKIQFE